jgi:hypothetical protein
MLISAVQLGRSSMTRYLLFHHLPGLFCFTSSTSSHMPASPPPPPPPPSLPTHSFRPAEIRFPNSHPSPGFICCG